MPSHSVIKEIIAAGELGKMLGLEEGLHFEAKKPKAYEPFDPQNLYELAKDTSCFANADGGIIALGLDTEQVPERETDKVIGLNLLEQNDFDKDRIHGRINELVYPRIKDLSVRWIPSSDGSGLGLGIIEIPKQDERKKYFLIQNIPNGEKQLKGSVFGIAIRQDAKIVTKEAADLHALIQKGMDPAKEQRDRMEGKLDHLLRAQSEVRADERKEKSEERIRRILGIG